MKTTFKNKKAFTLIELLIVIAIIGILFIVLVSKVDFATDKAKATGVQTDFRSFQLAFEQVAKENAERNNVAVDWLQADILSPIANNLLPIADIIVSNPPYICEKEKKDMAPRVLDHEPHSALFVPDTDPLLFYRQIASLAFLPSTSVAELQTNDLQAQPIYLFFEINEAYGNEVCAMMREMGYTNVQLKNDMYGKPRMVFGTING